MTNDIAPTKSETRPATLRERIDQMTPEFKKALPGHIPAERFVRTVQTAVQMNEEIARAAVQSDGAMRSLLAACTKAATDGLILDGREAALVTFNVKVSKQGEKDRWEKHVQYIPMVAGLMKKARNSGEISSMAAHVVYANDKFTYVLGDDEKIEHAPSMNADRGAPIAVYAIVRLKDGSVQREVMDRAAIARIAGQSKNPKQYDPAEGKNYGEWWRKTVIRRISKYLPSSSDRDEFMQAVGRIDDDFDFEADADADGNVSTPKPATKKRGGAAAALKNVTPVERSEPVDETPHDEDGVIIDNDDHARQPQDDI